MLPAVLPVGGCWELYFRASSNSEIFPTWIPQHLWHVENYVKRNLFLFIFIVFSYLTVARDMNYSFSSEQCCFQKKCNLIWILLYNEINKSFGYIFSSAKNTINFLVRKNLKTQKYFTNECHIWNIFLLEKFGVFFCIFAKNLSLPTRQYFYVALLEYCWNIFIEYCWSIFMR